MDVGIDGDQQHRRWKSPQSQIDAVVATDHPPQEQQEPFARAAGSRIRQQMPKPAGQRTRRTARAHEGVDEPAERFTQPRPWLARGRIGVRLHERRTERAVPNGDAPRAREQPRDVVGLPNAVNEAAERTSMLRQRTFAHRERRAITEHVEHLGDSTSNRRHLAERQGCGDEPRDLEVVGACVTTRDPERVGAQPLEAIGRREQRLQVQTQRRRRLDDAQRSSPGATHVAAIPSAVLGRQTPRTDADAARRALRACVALAFATALGGDAVAGAQDRVLVKGPYLQDVRHDGITVSIQAGVAGEFVVRAQAPGRAPVERRSRVVEGSVAHVELTGLSPATRYTYDASLAGTTARGSFFTAPEVGSIVAPAQSTIVAYGDDRTQHDVHARVVRAIRNDRPTLLLHTGDLVEDGSDEEDWQTFFDIERELLRSTPVHFALGNHEIGFGGDISLWRRYVRTPGGSPRPDRYWATSYGHIRIIGLDSNDDFSDGEQRRWLERELRAARSEHRARLVIAMAHHGPYSSGRHGDHRAMHDSGITSLLERHRVDLFLQGHDHVYERGESAAGLKYVITGGAGAPLYPWLRRSTMTRAFEAAHHHVRLVVRDTEVALSAIRPEGATLDRCSFQGPGGWRCARDIVAPDSPMWPPWAPRPWVVVALLAAFALGASVIVLRARNARRSARPQRPGSPPRAR